MSIYRLGLLCLFFISQTALSATNTVDSLKNEARNHPEQKAYYYFLIAQHFHQQTYGYNASNKDSTLRYLDIATKEAILRNRDSVLAKCYMYKGKVFSREGLFAESNEYTVKAKNLFKTLGDSIYVSKMEYIIAYNYIDLGLYDEGIYNLERALKRSGDSPDSSFVASMNLAMGSFLSYIEEFGASRKYINKAIRLFTNEDRLQKGGAIHNLARSYANSELYDSAQHYFETALEIWKEIGYQRGEGILYNSLSEFFSKQKKYKQAIEYLLKGEQLLQKVDDKRSLQRSYLKIAENYLLLNDTDQAKHYLKMAENINPETSPHEHLQELNRLKSKLQALLGHYKEAYFYQVEYMKGFEALVKQESDKKISQVNNKLEFLKKTKDLELQAISIMNLEQEKDLLEAKQVLYLIIMASSIIIALLIILYLIKRKRYEKRIHENNLKNSRILNEQLQEDIKYRKKKLSSFALQLIDKNQKLDDVKKIVKDLRIAAEGKKLADRLYSLEKAINTAINTEQSWQEFKLYFEEVHTDFFSKIKEIHPSISNRDLRLAALLKLNFSTKEIANLLSLSPKTIEVARYRLRKKLELKSEDNLIEYIMSI